MLSQVKALSSTLECQCITIQSKAIFSHGFVIIICHTFTKSISSSFSFQSSKTTAFFAQILISLAIAFEAFHLDFASKYFHKFISVIIETAASK